MKRISTLGVTLVTVLVLLGGCCCWPGPWHDGHGRGRYDNYRGGGHYERRWALVFKVETQSANLFF